MLFSINNSAHAAHHFETKYSLPLLSLVYSHRFDECTAFARGLLRFRPLFINFRFSFFISRNLTVNRARNTVNSRCILISLPPRTTVTPYPLEFTPPFFLFSCALFCNFTKLEFLASFGIENSIFLNYFLLKIGYFRISIGPAWKNGRRAAGPSRPACGNWTQPNGRLVRNFLRNFIFQNKASFWKLILKNFKSCICFSSENFSLGKYELKNSRKIFIPFRFTYFSRDL